MAEFLSNLQQKDLEYFNGKLDELLANPLYKLKYVLIHNQSIEGSYDNFENAITDAVSRFKSYEYIIQQVISDEETSGFIYSAYTPT